MLHAVTSHTAAELIVSRSDRNAPNMGLTAWKGEYVRKGDVATAKNYLAEAEIRELNLIVTMFLDTAELRASRRQQILLTDWETILDGFLAANELSVLRDAGSVSAVAAERIAHERYANFDVARKAATQAESAKIGDLGELMKIADAAASTKMKEGAGKITRKPRPARRKRDEE